MENNENLVLENGTEKVETVTTEEIAEQVTEPEKIYTEDQFQERVNEVSGKRAARKEAKVRKEYDRQYGGLMDVLRKGTGLETPEEIAQAFREHYESQGVSFTQEPKYSAKETEILAKAEADEIIRSGFDEVVEEAERLKNIGVENMGDRDRAVFLRLAEHIKTTETARDFAEIGVDEKEYGSKEFQDFAAMFEGSKTPMTKIYEIYTQTKPPKNIEPMGSVTSTVGEEAVKDYYSFEEASKFTKKDFDNNPALFKAVQNSMRKWK